MLKPTLTPAPASGLHNLRPLQGRLRCLQILGRKYIRDENCQWKGLFSRAPGASLVHPWEGSGRGAWPLGCHARGQQEGCSLGPQGAECGLRPEWALGDFPVGCSLAVSIGILALPTPRKGTFTIACKTQEDSQSKILFENLKPSNWVAGVGV